MDDWMAFEVEVDPDGSITLIWDKGSRWIVLGKPVTFTVGQSPRDNGAKPRQYREDQLREFAAAIQPS